MMNFSQWSGLLAVGLVLSIGSAPAPSLAQDGELTPLQRCIDDIVEHTDSEENTISAPASYGKCFEPDEIKRSSDTLLRFSSKPALGGIGYQVSIRPFDEESAAVRAVIVYGHPSSGWVEQLTVTSGISVTRFEELRQAFASAIAAGDPGPNRTVIDGQEVLLVCTDGPGYESEIFDGSGRSSLSGFCGDHPNRALAAQVRDLIPSAVDELVEDLP